MPKYKYEVHSDIGFNTSSKKQSLENFLNEEGERGNRIVSIIDEVFKYTVIVETEIIEY